MKPTVLKFNKVFFSFTIFLCGSHHEFLEKAKKKKYFPLNAYGSVSRQLLYAIKKWFMELPVFIFEDK